MGLNIKNERAHALVRELAELTHMSQTSAVEDAVRRRIAEIRAGEDALDPAVDEILSISADFQRSLTDEQRLALRTAHGDLYDAAGLPR